MNNKFGRELRRFRIRLTKYEFWPWWLFFLPLFPFYLYFAIRLRNPVYFTAANPGIDLGGFFGEKKNEIMKELPEQFLAKSLFFEEVDWEVVQSGLLKSQLTFPIVFKPDVGERGDEVSIIPGLDALRTHLASITYPFILQEYIDYPIELGVFYSRLPSSDSGRILSIVQKKFLSVIGDGTSTVEKLIKSNDRGFLQLPRLRRERLETLALIPTKGRSIVVEPIGNHCLGTEFINANHLISEKLNKVFDEISLPFEGFYYGRYDLRIKSIDEMSEGKGIRIFELNGVTSEPGHIYDKKINIFQAYMDLIQQQRVVYQICRQNLSKDGQVTKLPEVLKRAYQHFFKSKR